MPVTDNQVRWLRAYLAGDLDEVQRLHAHPAALGEAAGIGALVYAAFAVAARRKFAPGWTRADVAQFAGRVRQSLSDRPEALDPVIAEQELRGALGEKPSRGSVKSRGRAQFVLLNALVADLDLSDADVAGLIDQARGLADNMLADGTGRPTELAGTGRPKPLAAPLGPRPGPGQELARARRIAHRVVVTGTQQAMTDQTALPALRQILPAEVIVTDPDITAGYRQDCARDPRAGMPLAVVRPTSAEDVQSVLRWASAYHVPVVPRGAGSGLSGGASAVAGGIVLSLERMRAVSVNPAARVAVAQPGASNAEVKKAAAAHGLWYPPDPSSFELSSIGGNVATNAGGLCCVKYGVTADYVLGMQVVLADGTALRLGGPRLKDAAGLSLAKLFVGSEGILGVITELTLRLLPAQGPTWALVAVFGSVEAAADAVVAITSKVRPAMLELMDNASINAVEDLLHMDLDRAAGALLIARSDAPGAAAADEIAVMTEACSANGATEVYSTDDEAEGEAFAAARRAVFAAMERLGEDLLLEDVGVPLPELPSLVRGLERIGAENGVQVATVAHAGDGNTHPVIAYTASDPDSTARARKAFSEIIDLALSLGGTITGEHGTGRLKAPWLPDQLGPGVMALTERIKHALDPAGILNPGALLREREQATARHPGSPVTPLASQ